jgi:hypothetical protein
MNNEINGFTHTYAGEPLPPEKLPYIRKIIVPCTTGKQLAKAIAPMPVQTFRSNKVGV